MLTEPRPRRSIRVVVLDDHEVVAESLTRLLEGQADITVVGRAGTAADGLAAIEAERPDVVVLDHRLPDTTGIDLSRRLLAADPAARILLLTGAGDDDVLAAAVQAGCAGYLEKTCASRELVAAIRAVARGELAFPANALARVVPRLRGHPPVGVELTPREREVLALLADGLGNQQIAQRLTVSVNTVRSHVHAVLAKLGAHTKLEAVAVARRRHLLGP